MKKLSVAAVLMILVSLSSCRVIGDIFKAGVWAGVLMVVGIIVLVILVISKLFGGSK